MKHENNKGKNVLLHLENIMLNGWNVPKWKKPIILWCIWSTHRAVQGRHYSESYEPQNGGFRANKTKLLFFAFKKTPDVHNIVTPQALYKKSRKSNSILLHSFWFEGWGSRALSLISLFNIPLVYSCFPVLAFVTHAHISSSDFFWTVRWIFV